MSNFIQFLDVQDVTGAMVITVAAVVAMVSLSLALLHILLALVIPAYARRMSSPQERNFVMSPLGFYIICLFASNLISAFGGVLDARWVGARAITQGPICTTQAFLLQLGNNAAALWIAVISISALRTFMFRARSLSKLVTLPLIFLLWAVMIVFDGLASTIFADHSGEFFYGIAGMWCWITPSHRLARLVIQYIWMWVWSLVSAVCFFLVFLSVRGNITVKRDGKGRSLNWSKRSFNSYALGSGEEQYGTLVGAVGKTMCWFPISYITLTIPIAVTRLSETFGFPVPTYAFVFSAVNLSLIGIVTPVLYFAIRHSLKHASVRISSDVTLRGSYGGDKVGTESFHTPHEKRPSPVSKFDPYPWTPTPTTKEWAPPSPHHGISEATSPFSSVVAYAMTTSEDGTSNYRTPVGNASPRQVPVSSKLAQRSRSFHRPMESISTVTSSGTVVGPGVQLSPVSEGEPFTESAATPQLTLPPAALVARRQSVSSPNGISPSDFGRLAKVPLSPALQSGHKRSDTNVSVYTGPRAISPDLNALMQATQTPSSPTGPPPPPRKARRPPIPSVPVDVDESDEGSICSARPSVEEFSPEDTRPMSLGDVTTRHVAKRADSMRTFWAAYEEPSPITPDMPIPGEAASLRRDTMRTFWAAYENPSPTRTDMPMPLEAASPRYKTDLEWNDISPSSSDFRRVDSSVFLKPSISAVGRAPTPKETLSPMSIYNTPSAASRVMAEHRRSRSFTPMPAPPAPAMSSNPANLRPSTSAIARFNLPPARNAPTPTPSARSGSETSYRTPRPQPGYV